MLKPLIETENIKTFDQIFSILPKTVVAKDMGINYVRFLAKIRKPEEFRLKDLMTLSSLMGSETELILKLILTDIRNRKTARKKA